jgi:hypothetical protein
MLATTKRSLKAIAADINAHPELGLRAEVKSSWSNTDSDISGSRLRWPGKGRNGLKLTVTLVRMGKPVCEVDTSRRYEQASEAEKWLGQWRGFRRLYHRVPSPNINQYFVEGEPYSSCGRVMTVGQLKALPKTDLVWVRVKELGEGYYSVDGVSSFTLDEPVGDTCIFWNDPGESELGVLLPKRGKDASAVLKWSEKNRTISIHKVTLTKYKFKEKKR